MASAVKSSSNPQPSYAEKTVPHRHGHSGPELLASVPDPSLPNYIARFDANDLSRSFAQVGIASLEPRLRIRPMITPIASPFAITSPLHIYYTSRIMARPTPMLAPSHAVAAAIFASQIIYIYIMFTIYMK